MVKEAWGHLNDDEGSYFMMQFAKILEKINLIKKMWMRYFNDCSQALLNKTEEGIEVLLGEKPIGSLSPEEEISLGELLKKKQ
jgi:hypothetical protein